MMLKAWWLGVALCVLVAVGCGSGGRDLPAPSPVSGLVTVPVEGAADYVPPASATPWPTFTVAPAASVVAATVDGSRVIPGTPTPNPLHRGGPRLIGTPAAAVDASGSPEPTVSTPVEPEVTAEPVVGLPVEPTVTASVPTPTPFGLIREKGGGEARFIEQSLFPLMVADLDPVVLDDLPEPTDFISREARLVVWAARYDMTYVPEDFVLDGFVQWWDMGPAEVHEPFVMLEEPVSITKAASLLWQGVGRQTPGFWQPGPYRVAFLDDDHEEVVSWSFEVR